MIDNKSVEIMAPAGSFESLMAAIKAGADSVYFGVGKLNMRARSAKNFQLEDLAKITEICKKHHIKSYLALNTILYDYELDDMRFLCKSALDAEVTAIIASDIAVIQYAREIGIEVHLSTQLNISNVTEVRFYSQFADVMVLARELTVEQVRHIVNTIEKEEIRGPKGELVQIELFVHGALCVSVSGKCYMSLANTGHSANRGDCFQTCRRSYRVIDETTDEELVIDNKYVMSPRDLCTIRFVDQLVATGASVFKIEGRGRREEYVYRVTKAYKDAVAHVQMGTFDHDKAVEWEQQLEKVFNRGFWHGGYYMGRHWDEWSASYGSRATQQKVYLGYVKHYFRKAGVAEFLIETGDVNVGDALMITGPTTGIVEATVESIYVNDAPAESAQKGDAPTLKMSEKVRRNDKLYKVIDRKDYQG